MKWLLIYLGAIGFLLARPALAADSDLPGPAFDSNRYAPLWENSPFAVATPVAMESQEYFLVGVAQFDGVSYASIVDKQNQNHFVVTSATPVQGLKLVSLTRGQDAGSTFATFEKDGALLKLRLETGGSGPSPAVGIPTPAPVVISPVQPQMMFPGRRRFPPRPRIFVPPIYVPQPTANSQ